MRLLIRPSAVAFVLAVAVGPALARKPARTPCSGHFLLDSGQALVTNATSTGTDSVEVAGKRVTIGGTCTATGSLRTTRTGCPKGAGRTCWRLGARWNSCGDLVKPRVTLKIGFSCQKLTVSLRAKRRTPRRYTASLSACDAGAVSYASTWEAIQNTIFARHDCANVLCHGGATPQGGLDLRPDVAYKNLVQVASTELPSLSRVAPGDERQSYLWLKLLWKTDEAKLPDYLPHGVQLSGAPMPNNTSTLSPDELEVLRLWIYATAPETGTVAGTQALLNACLPPLTPITAIPLDAPPPDQGHQFVMPPWRLEAHSQHELCFATYFDFTDQVPAPFKDSFGNFLWNAQSLRQDPQSHHLILNLFSGSLDQSTIHDPSFGAWTCAGGATDGQPCEPTDVTSCGTGICRSKIEESFGCFGYGPRVNNSIFNFFAIGGAQKPQSDTDFA